ncbi:YraN family protein [Salisaeta longa]|uniref:YraN family protein n=1 Tax=Salisaeta longa TaxID=503170 RepID=UPI0003B539AE|nr:YraN family protein [Salisaeta longa]
MDTTKEIGDHGEDLAMDFLTTRGYRVMDRNYRFEHGEVDAVCYDPAARDGRGELVFVEVKTRSSLAFGTPEEAVTDEKQARIAHAARAYLYERQLEGSPARFDVVTVVLRQGDDPAINHFPDAFWAGA